MEALWLDPAEGERPILWAQGRAVSVAELLESVERVAAALPAGTHLVNLCERRDHFLAACCAALARGHSSLMPPSRAPDAVRDVEARFPGAYRCDDETVARAMGAPAGGGAVAGRGAIHVPLDHAVAIAFTSGTTGMPQAHVKRCRALLGSAEFNAARIRECLEPRYGGALSWIVATVPAQHMYGAETTLLLPLAAGMAVHVAKPLFPADVAAALAEVPAPRVLVTTPVHLRALVESRQRFPEIGVIVSATAPLDAQLAREAERSLATIVLEMFGSTETCVIATRLTAREESWSLYPGVTVTPGASGTVVEAPWFDAPTALQDVIELEASGRFKVRGRNVDLVEVAGKRASLADLTRRLLAVAGVRDAVVFQPDVESAGAGAGAGAGVGAGAVRRVAALVVAPGLDAETITARLAAGVDPAFLPRPLVIVAALPRNELGKLARAELLRLAGEHAPHAGERVPHGP